MRKGLILFSIFSFNIFLVQLTYGQFRNSYWKQSRKEIFIGAGASNFLGEPGGRDQIGTDFVQDLEISETKYAIEVGYRYFLLRDLALKTSIYHGMVSGDDALTKEPGRNNRNISFRTPIYELSTMLEYHVVHEKEGSRYKIRGAKGQASFVIGVHPFIGIGITYFQPQGQYIDGSWHNLKPLNTEGQNLEGGSEPYNLYTVVIPVGLGLRYSLNGQMKIGLEMGVRKTFSDYIDDTGGAYYDNATLLAENGPISAHFADPSLGRVNTDGNGNIGAGEIRGDSKDKDAYMFAVVSLNYKLSRRRGFRRIKKRGSVPSF